jgi:hypothetical protein
MSTQHGPQSAPNASNRSKRAIRLMFEYEGDQVRLVERWSMEKVIPPSDPTDARAKRNQSGFWVEVQGARNRTLYRLVRANPIETSVEVRTGDPDQPLARETVDQPRGTFFVLVPDLPGAEDVVLYSSPVDSRDARAATQPARELARFDLRQPIEPDQPDDGKERPS